MREKSHLDRHIDCTLHHIHIHTFGFIRFHPHLFNSRRGTNSTLKPELTQASFYTMKCKMFMTRKNPLAMTGFYVTKSDIIGNVQSWRQNLKFKTFLQNLRSSDENFCSAVWCKRKLRWKRNCDFTCAMQWWNAGTSTVRNARAFEYLKKEICRYWQVNNLNVLNQTETRLFFVRPTHAIKGKRARIRGEVSKKRRVTIMLTRRLFRPRRENRQAPTKIKNLR